MMLEALRGSKSKTSERDASPSVPEAADMKQGGYELLSPLAQLRHEY